jgi:hypothetical protein
MFLNVGLSIQLVAIRTQTWEFSYHFTRWRATMSDFRAKPAPLKRGEPLKLRKIKQSVPKTDYFRPGDSTSGRFLVKQSQSGRLKAPGYMLKRDIWWRS